MNKEKIIKYKKKYITSTKSQTDDYPYYKNYYSLTYTSFINMIKNFNPIIVNNINEINSKNKRSLEKCDGKYMLIKEDWDKNEELNNITDLFTEECRVKCVFGNNISPYEYWEKNKINLLKSTYTDNNKLRDIIYKNTKLCNNFRISVALTVLNIFWAKRWLDISAGWGDRLIAAIAYNLQLYCAVDPNECLHKYYNNIINTLVPDEDKRSNYIMIKGGFEHVELPNYTFDLVFSSPPFFDMEIYSDSKDDSYVKYKDHDAWFNNFLMASIKKAFKYLEKNGHLVLYMGESHTSKYIPNMISQVSKFMDYKGIIYYYYPSVMKFRQLFVWQKK